MGSFSRYPLHKVRTKKNSVKSRKDKGKKDNFLFHWVILTLTVPINTMS